MAAQHLIDCGCKSIVCVRGLDRISSASERYKGYQDVCMEQGIKEHSIQCDYSFHEGLEMTQKLLEQFPDVDGIIACNDMVAISIYKVLCRRNIRVPEDIQLIGYDNGAYHSGTANQKNGHQGGQYAAAKRNQKL